jgi:hypothetical protein
MSSVRGITNSQARLLAALQSELGEPYTGRGLTLAEASEAIDDALDRKAARKREWAARKEARRVDVRVAS